MSATGRPGWPYLDWPHPIAFAHRGGAGENPENTMRAFEAAVAQGYRYLETDVHATADGVLLAFHDHRLSRVTDQRGEVGRLAWSEVRRALVDGEPIPRLEDVLGAWPDIRVNIDIKHEAAVRPLAEALERSGAFDRVCVGAFSSARVRRVRGLIGGRVCTWMGRAEILRLALAGRGVPARPFVADCAQVPARSGGVAVLDERLVEVAHRRGLAVHAWTVNDRAEMIRLLDLGVDGIMTDRPTVLRKLLLERGQWS